MAVAGRVLATFSLQARGIKFYDVSTSSIRVGDSLEFRQSTNALQPQRWSKRYVNWGEFPIIREPNTCAVKRHALQQLYCDVMLKWRVLY